jgi:hypothetical protein
MNMASHELPPIVLPRSGLDPQQQQAVDMEALAHYILSSAQFQQLLTTQVHADTQATQKAQPESANLQQEQHHMYMKVQLF